MSQLSLEQLTKKNQEFIHTATKQLIQDGKTDQEIKEILSQILPELIDNQKKGITAKGLYGSPTIWARSFTASADLPAQKVENDKPILMWMDSVFLILGFLGLINGATSLLSTTATRYGIITLLLLSLSGGGVFYALYHYIYRYYEPNSGNRPPFFKSFLIIALATIGWMGVLLLSALLPKHINPAPSGLLLLIIGGISLALRFYLKKKYNIKSSMQGNTRRV